MKKSKRIKFKGCFEILDDQSWKSRRKEKKEKRRPPVPDKGLLAIRIVQGWRGHQDNLNVTLKAIVLAYFRILNF